MKIRKCKFMATLTPLCSLQLGQGRRNHLEWLGLEHQTDLNHDHELINVKNIFFKFLWPSRNVRTLFFLETVCPKHIFTASADPVGADLQSSSINFYV